MKKYFQSLLVLSLVFTTIIASAQVGVGTITPDASAQLDVTSNTKGVLFPRMNASERAAIESPAEGLLVYQTEAPSGFYYYMASEWVKLANSAESTTATVPSFYAGNSLGSLIAVVLGGSNISFPSDQIISSGFSINGSNNEVIVTDAGRYKLSYRLTTTASLLVGSRILLNGMELAGSRVFPMVATTNFATSVIADLPAGATISLQFYGMLGVATLNSDSQYLSILKLQ